MMNDHTFKSANFNKENEINNNNNNIVGINNSIDESRSVNFSKENNTLEAINYDVANESKFLNLELGDTFNVINSSNSVNSNNNDGSLSSVAVQTNVQSNNTTQNTKTASLEVLLLNFILKNISNGFKPTKTQVSFILKNKNITDTNSVNYWFKLFVEKLIKINRNKKNF